MKALNALFVTLIFLICTFACKSTGRRTTSEVMADGNATKTQNENESLPMNDEENKFILRQIKLSGFESSKNEIKLFHITAGKNFKAGLTKTGDDGFPVTYPLVLIQDITRVKSLLEKTKAPPKFASTNAEESTLLAQVLCTGGTCSLRASSEPLAYTDEGLAANWSKDTLGCGFRVELPGIDAKIFEKFSSEKGELGIIAKIKVEFGAYDPDTQKMLPPTTSCPHAVLTGICSELSFKHPSIVCDLDKSSLSSSDEILHSFKLFYAVTGHYWYSSVGRTDRPEQGITLLGSKCTSAQCLEIKEKARQQLREKKSP